MSFLNRLRLWQRLLLYLLPILVIPFAIVAYLVLTRWTSDLESNLQQIERSNIQLERVELEQFFQLLEADIQFMRERPATTDMALALAYSQYINCRNKI
ncbi:MAG: hypothetical protein ACOCX5_06105, partial [Chloroflexota bacterium]